jgi:hypothetical protein
MEEGFAIERRTERKRLTLIQSFLGVLEGRLHLQL